MNEQISNKSIRIGYIDITKFIAIIAVIICHIYGRHAGYILPNADTAICANDIIGVAYVFGKVGVPLFFLCTGALLFKKEFRNCNDVLTFYKKGLLGLFVAGEIWNITYLFIEQGVDVTVKDLFMTFLMVKKPTLHLWYLRIIVLYYALFPLVSFLFKKRWVRYIIITVILCASFLFNIYLFAKGFVFPTTIASLSCYLVYMWIGYWVNEHKIKISSWVLFLISFLFFVTLYSMWISKSLIFIWYDNILVFFISIFLFMGIKKLFQNVHIPIMIADISKMSYGIYLFHIIPLMLFIMCVNDLNWNKYLVFIFSIIITFLSSYIVIKICNLYKPFSKCLFRY